MVQGMLESFYLSFISFINTIIPTYVLPNLQLIISVLLLLLVGYIVGKIIKSLSVRILNAVGLKRITARSWAEGVLKTTGYRGSIVELIADLVKWLVYILFFALIIQTLGLPGVADIFTSFAVFIPRFIGAILIIVIGFIIAEFFGKLFEEAAHRFLSEDILSSLAGGLVKYSISLISIIMSLALIGLDVTAITVLFAVILAAVVVVMLLGIKEIFPNYTSGVHLKSTLRPGEFITVGKYSGVVEKLQPLSVILRDGQKRIEIPNSFFLGTPIERKARV